MSGYVGLSSFELQNYLKSKGVYKSSIDGIEGPNTQNAVEKILEYNKHIVETAVFNENYSRKRLAVSQIYFRELKIYSGKIDGLYGPSTEYAIEQYQNYLRNVDRDSSNNTNWPTYNNIERFYGEPGTNHTIVTLPYTMKLAWDTSQSVSRITINRHCSESFLRVMNNVLKVYGIDNIVKLRLDMFGGCFNDRNMRGGSRKSTHSYAAALDFDPENNPLRSGADRATFARPEYNKWWECWEQEGWVSLGRERNYDWMHVQAVRL